MMPRRWRGVIAFEGVETGDRRMFEPNAVYWRGLPRDFGVIFEDGMMGHENAITVGTADLLERREGGVIYGEGPLFDDDENADRYANMLRQGGMRNVSVDVCAGTARYEIVDSRTGEVVPPENIEDVIFDPEFEGYERQIWEAAEICSLVAARTCAFADAVIELVDDAETEPVADDGLRLRGGAVYARAGAAFTTLSDLPVGEEVRWVPDDGDEAVATVTAVDEEAGTVTLEVNGERVEAAAEDDGSGDGSGAAATSQAAASNAGARVSLAAALARRNGHRVVTASVGRRGPGAVLRASVAWDEGPPRSFYEPLELAGPTPFTITDKGEVFGHIALWEQCHAGFNAGAFGQCIQPPRSPSGYRTFYANRTERFSDGSRLPVGVLTMDTMHAPATDRRTGQHPDLRTVLRHYEHTGLIGATLRVYEDEFGAYGHGAVCAGLSVEDVRRAMVSAPSGDWRDYGEGLDLAGILLVNQPGYPVVEREEGRTYALVASLAPRRAEVRSPALAHAACSCGCDGAGTCGATPAAVTASQPPPSAAPRAGQPNLDLLEQQPPRRYIKALARRHELARLDAGVLGGR